LRVVPLSDYVLIAQVFEIYDRVLREPSEDL